MQQRRAKRGAVYLAAALLALVPLSGSAARGKRPYTRYEFALVVARIADALELRVTGGRAAPEPGQLHAPAVPPVLTAPPAVPTDPRKPLSPQGTLRPDPFADVPPDHWAYNALEFLRQQGLGPDYDPRLKVRVTGTHVDVVRRLATEFRGEMARAGVDVDDLKTRLVAMRADVEKRRAAPPRREPLCLHPENPHVFLFRGKPTVLVASTEHYGSVMNLDFDYRAYLDEVKACGLNYTRLFSGVYCEPWGEPFNTLNPPKERTLAPWARSRTPGYADGGNKFDLKAPDPTYLLRLRDFVAEAGRRGIVVEITLFCNWYDDGQWRLSPLNADNNVDGVGDVGFKDVNTLKNGPLLAYQERVLKWIVTEVNPYDNLFFEVCNEPGADGDWMDHMAGLIYDTETALPSRHLIANNFHATPHLSILNAHYDRDCSFVGGNYGRGIAIGYDETGFDGAEDAPYRRQGWSFLLNGGGLYDNLDWSFSVAHPDGTETQWNKGLGGGSRTLRQQLGVLLAFMDGLDLAAMAPDASVVRGGAPGKVAVLSDPGRQYALYLDGGEQATLSLELPAGRYRAEWVGTKTGNVAKSEEFQHAGGERILSSPPYYEDIALRIVSTVPDRTPPAIERVDAIGERTVRVRFSERVQAKSAAAPGSYRIDHGVRVAGAALGADGRTVTLTTTPLAVGVPYTLSVSGVADRAAPANVLRVTARAGFRLGAWTLIRAVNLGGPALTIEGTPWEAGDAAGVTYTGGHFENQAVPLDPPAEGARAAMIRSSIWNHQGSNVTLAGVPDGTYQVCLTIWEDNDSQTFDILLNGTPVQQRVASGAAGHWARLGPWVTSPAEGKMELRCTPGDANLSGIELWRESAPAKKGSAMKEETPAGWPDALLLVEAR